MRYTAEPVAARTARRQGHGPVRMSESTNHDADRPLESVQHALRERVKELTCLYDVSALLTRAGEPAAGKLQAVVERLPAGWQHPDLAAARLSLADDVHTSARWAQARNGLRAAVQVEGRDVGQLEVVYTDDVPATGGEPFLAEERLLIDEIARRVGTFLENERHRRTESLDEALAAPLERNPAGDGPQGLIGASEPMQRVYRAIEKAAQTDATILIWGESGTGKELVARAIHYASARSTEPFVPVNCAAIPESLVESELFGYVKGAFTGATHARAGFFQTAAGGTIFLDEIGEMMPSMQAKLLRVLENNEIRMLGSDRTLHADTRIVAATNQDVAALVRAKRFRADLYFRLNVLSIELPPLRERGADLDVLLRHFGDKWGREARGQALEFSDGALRALRDYDWPGNVRELENLVHRWAVMLESGFVDVEDLPGPLRSAPVRSPGKGSPDERRSLAEVERQHVHAVLRSVAGNRSEAARILGIDRKTLRKKLGSTARD